MKTSNALLAAWIVLIAALVGAIVYFTLNAQAPTPPDAPVKPVAAKPKPPEPKGPTRRPGRNPSVLPTPPMRAEITGVVYSPDGAPAQGARVAIFPPTKPGQPDVPADMDEIRTLNQIIYISTDEWDLPRPLATWTGGSESTSGAGAAELAGCDTGADGRFTLPLASHIGPGPFRLTAAKEGVGSAMVVEARSGQRLELTLGLAAGVKGTVITEVGSVPVADARVSFDSGAKRFTALSGADGTFFVEGVAPGFYQLSVSAKGKTPLFESRFRVAGGDSTPYTLRMPRGTFVRVKTLLEKSDDAVGTPRRLGDGDPVSNAEVVMFSEDTFTYVMGRTNAEGFVDFPGMPAGRWVLNGKAFGVVSMGEEPVTIDRNDLTKDETLRFEAAVDTTIEVVDEDGRPVASMDFYTVNSDEKYDSLRSTKAATTDGDGKLKFAFEFDGPRCSLYGFKTGFSLVRAYPDDYQSGDPVRLVAKKPVRVHGMVRTSERRPIPDAIVAITIAAPENQAFDDLELEIRTDSEGRYDFPFLQRSEGITVGATAPDGISADEQDLELVGGKDEYTLDLEIELDDTSPPVPRTPAPPRVKAPDPGDKGNEVKRDDPEDSK
jgi:hypothetical protein